MNREKERVEKMKVLEACDVYLPDVDGVIHCIHNCSLNMSKNADVTLIAPKNRKTYVDNQPYSVIRCKSLRVPVMNVHYGFPLSDKKFDSKVMSKDYDIVHVHSPFNFSKYSLSVAKRKNIPVVATFHSDMRRIYQSVFHFKPLTNFLVKRLGKIYNQFDEVFCCSPLVEEQLRSYGYSGKVTYLPFGTDFIPCDNTSELANKANEKLDIDPKEIVFIYVGRIMKLKRIDFILDSLKIVKEKGMKFKFYVVGKGPEAKKLQRYAKKLGLDDYVRFCGFLGRDDFPLINARADLLLFPSLYDNFGLVKVESAAYHTAGIYIKDSCAGYGIIDGVNGFLADNTKEAFANKICEAMEDKAKLDKIGDNAARDIYISWADCAAKLQKRLQEIVKEKKNGN